MFFRNLSCYRFTSEIDLDALAAALHKCALRPVGPLELSTLGFVAPLGEGELAHWVGDAMLVSVATQERLLPSDVLNRALNARLRQITADEDRKVGSKERKRIKEELFTLMLPQAFVRERKTNLYFTRDGWLVIDHASRKVVEAIITLIRNAAGSFPCVPMAPEESPRALMTGWVTHQTLPSGFYFGDQVEIRDPAEAGAVVRCSNQDLQSDEVLEHIKSGKQVWRLALIFGDRLSFVLDDALCVHKLRFLDVVQDEVQDGLDGTFALMSLELKLLLAWMETTFGISPAPKLRLDGGTAAPEMRQEERDVSEARDEVDPLYEKALAHVRETKRASISALQRHLKVGYNRAARLVETMEQQGAVSAPKHDGTREVLGPLISQKAADGIAKKIQDGMRAKGHKVRVTATVGNDIGERLNAAELPPYIHPYRNSGERGLSADTLVAKLGGVNTSGCALCHPLDPDDLRRCRLALEQIPELASRIGEMREVSPEWAQLVDVWGTLCATMDDECPTWRGGIGTAPNTYEFMQQLGC